jgi:hypothetical protein
MCRPRDGDGYGTVGTPQCTTVVLREGNRTPMAVERREAAYNNIPPS